MSRLMVVWSVFFLMLAPLRAQYAAPSTPSEAVLRALLESLEARLQQKEIPADPQNLALLKFKIEQAQLLFKNENTQPYYGAPTMYNATRSAIDAILARAESVASSHGDAVYPSLSQMHERAYIARNDGSVQPYWVFVPKDYTPQKQWPLVVFLHGYSPDISKVAPWLPGPETWQLATERGFILAVPYGRRNSDFVGIGEDDTLAVTEAVSTRYNVDAERTFLMGPSMGGFGVHAIGLHHPDRFAALTTLSARTDFYLWFNLQREEVPAWKRVLYDADDPRHLKRNAARLPIFMQHGALDEIVPAEHSRRLYTDLKALNYPAFYREIPDGSHYIYWEHSVYEIALDWLQKLQRAPVPHRVQYSTGALRNNKAHWAEIRGFEDYSRLAHIDAEIKEGNVIDVKTENVARFQLAPPQEFLDMNAPLTLVVNGLTQPETFDAGKAIRWPRAEQTQLLGSQLLKSPHRAGPIKEVYRDPFLLVYGTLQSDGDEKNARRFLLEWDAYADGLPPLKADRDVTHEDKKNFNLILFGTRESNLLLQSTAGKMPLELTPTGYRIGDVEYSSDGRNLGLQFCYPSPFNSARMIVVQSGEFWGTMLPVNHKLDLLPEFIVYDETIDPSDQTNRALVAGFFDDNWQLPANIELSTPNVEPPTLNVEQGNIAP